MTIKVLKAKKIKIPLSMVLQKETSNDSSATLLSKQNEQPVELLVNRSSIESFQSHIFSAVREQCLGGKTN